jgi:hypothetical protein
MTVNGENTNSFPAENLQKIDTNGTAQEYARHHLMVALTRMGYSIKSFEEAWGQLVAIQAEIAADPDNGSKATSAIKFVAEAIGISSKNITAGDETQNFFPDLSLEDAEKLLVWLNNDPLNQLSKNLKKD